MAYNEKLGDKIRETLAHIPKVEEKKCFVAKTLLVRKPILS
jgi:hypothetical protein